MSRTQIYLNGIAARAAWYRAGYLDKAEGLPRRSPNGTYVDGWYAHGIGWGHNYPGIPSDSSSDTNFMADVEKRSDAIRKVLGEIQ